MLYMLAQNRCKLLQDGKIKDGYGWKFGDTKRLKIIYGLLKISYSLLQINWTVTRNYYMQLKCVNKLVNEIKYKRGTDRGNQLVHILVENKTITCTDWLR